MFKKKEEGSVLLTDIYFSKNGLKAYKFSKYFLVSKLISYFATIFTIIFGLYRYIFNNGELILLILSICLIVLSFVFSFFARSNAKKSIKITAKDIEDFYLNNGGKANVSLNVNNRTFARINPKSRCLEIYHDEKLIFDVNFKDISSVSYIPDISKKNSHFSIAEVKGISAYSRITIEYTNLEKKKVIANFDLCNFLTIENQLAKDISKAECKKIYAFHKQQFEKLETLINNAKNGNIPTLPISPNKEQVALKTNDSSIKEKKDKEKNRIRTKKTPKVKQKKNVFPSKSAAGEKIKGEINNSNENSDTKKYIKSNIFKPDEEIIKKQPTIDLPEDIKKDILKKESNPEIINKTKKTFDK